MPTSQAACQRLTFAMVTIGNTIVADDVVRVVGISAVAVIEIRTAAEIAIGAVVLAQGLLSVGILFRSHFEDFI